MRRRSTVRTDFGWPSLLAYRCARSDVNRRGCLSPSARQNSMLLTSNSFNSEGRDSTHVPASQVRMLAAASCCSAITFLPAILSPRYVTASSSAAL